MNRFLLFAGSDFHPSGGWHDFRGSFDTLDEAVYHVAKNASANGWDWFHVVDTDSQQIVRD